MLQLASDKPKVLYRAILGPFAADTTTTVTIPDVGDISRCIEKRTGCVAQAGGADGLRIRLLSSTQLEVVNSSAADSLKVHVEIVQARGMVYRSTISIATTAAAAPGTSLQTIPDVGDLSKVRHHCNGCSASGVGYGVTFGLEFMSTTQVRGYANVYNTGTAVLAYVLEY